MARRIELKGKAKTYVGIAGLILCAWLVLGQTLFSFDFGFFKQGYQVSFFRGGHFESQGVHWDQQDRILGRVVSPGNETLVVDLDATITRGTLVVFAWRWPAFLHGEPMRERVRYSATTKDRLTVALPDPGLYMLSISAVYLGGDISVDWDVGGS